MFVSMLERLRAILKNGFHHTVLCLMVLYKDEFSAMLALPVNMIRFKNGAVHPPLLSSVARDGLKKA